MATAAVFMDEAVRLCREGMDQGHGGPFGAVIVRDGKVIGKSSNRVFEKCDPTAHAEVEAIRDACANTQTTELSGSTIYCTGEPCPMCMAAIYWAQIDAVIFANTKEEAKMVGFDDSKIYRELALPWNGRTLSLVHAPHDGAKEAFQVWKDKAAAGELQ